MRDVALESAIVERFARDLAACSPRGKTPVRIAVAVSGGADSLALMLLARSVDIETLVATVDHGLRSEAASEARFVGEISRSLGLRHATLRLSAPKQGNLSDWARRERYQALQEWALDEGVPLILTAHHADDQLETMIMRLNRGSGVGGLSGVRSTQSGQVALGRPLLSWRKAELEKLVCSAGLSPILDPSNADDRFDRARLRKELACADWLDPVAASRSARALGEAEVALEWAARAYAARRVAETGGVISFDPKDLPRELVRRILIACLIQISPDAKPRATEIDRLMLGLFEGRTATLAGVRCTGGVFWLFARAKPRAGTSKGPE